jgi:hypothetical protein
MNDLVAATIMGLFGFTAGTPQLLFNDSFESGSLQAWTGKSGGPTSATIVSDPLNPGNNVMTFASRTQNGDAFTAASIPIGGLAGPVHLQFDYLGVQANAQAPSENLGGFAGIAPGYFLQVSSGAWLAGTEPTAVNGLGILDGTHLVDDGTWHSYSIDLTPYVMAFLSANGTLQAHIALQDWNFSSGSSQSPAGDAYFDNISIVMIPETSTLGMALVGIGTLLAHRKRRHSPSP